MIFFVLFVFIFGILKCDDSCFNKFLNITIVNNIGTSLSNEDVLLAVDVSGLSGFQNCSMIRFQEKESDTWMDYWVESECNPSTTSLRVWVTVPSLPATSLEVYMYYDCDSLPSPNSGNELSNSNEFYIMSNYSSCGDSTEWTYSSNGEGKFLQVSNAASFSTNSGFETHIHSLNGAYKNDSGSANVTTLNGATGTILQVTPILCSHEFSLSSSDAIPSSLPPYYSLAFCSNDHLPVLPIGSVLLLNDSYSTDLGSSSSMRRFDEVDGVLVMGSALPGTTGGSAVHYHNFSGFSELSSYTSSIGIRSDCCVDPDPKPSPADHLHYVEGNLSYVSNFPESISSIFAQIESESENDENLSFFFYFSSGLPPKGFSLVDETKFGTRYLLGDSSFGTITASSDGIHSRDYINGELVRYDAYEYSGQVELTGSLIAASWNHTHELDESLTFTQTDSSASTAPSSSSLPTISLILVERKSQDHVTVIVGSSSTPKCFDVWGDEETVCSGHGTCIDNDDCTCDGSGTYLGDDCGLWTCSGIQNNSTDVCGGEDQGSCVDVDECECINDYWGTTCESFNCSEWIYTNENASAIFCNGRGNCTAPNKCTCESSYSGDECDSFKCFGYSNTDTENVCSGHGTCTDIDECVCTDSSLYSGPACNYWSCFGLNTKNASTSVCSGEGVCVDVDTCDCEGYFTTGDECEKNYGKEVFIGIIVGIGSVAVIGGIFALILAIVGIIIVIILYLGLDSATAALMEEETKKERKSKYSDSSSCSSSSSCEDEDDKKKEKEEEERELEEMKNTEEDVESEDDVSGDEFNIVEN